jgi:hypothetical protein
MVGIQRVYSLQQAANLTGFSLGKFRYNRKQLIATGAVVSSDGWRIPHSTLKEMGWLGVKTPKAPVAEPSALELAELRVRELEAELAELKEQSAKKTFFGLRRKQ